MNVWREVAVVLGYEVRALLFGVRAILVLITYGAAAGVSGAAYVWIAGKIEEQLVSDNPALAMLDRKAMLAEMMRSEQFREQIGPALEWLGGEALFDAVLSGQMPWVLLLVLLTSTFLLPGLALLVGYDRISEDLSTKNCRFILQRIHRGSWLAGKVLGHWAGMLVLVILVHTVLIGIGAAVVPAFQVDVVLAALPRLWLGMALFLLAYSAFVAVFSSLVTPPFASLALGGAALSALWILSIVTELRLVWMGTWDMRLWVLDPSAIGVYAAHTAVLFGIAWAVLRWRDV